VIVSGGFHAERIAAFEAAKVPVDSYAVGSSLLKGECDYTADVVLREGRPCAKTGRRYRPSDRLEEVDLAMHNGRHAAADRDAGPADEPGSAGTGRLG
jgi:nicotinic acid phosphoribosyltransferase